MSRKIYHVLQTYSASGTCNGFLYFDESNSKSAEEFAGRLGVGRRWEEKKRKEIIFHYVPRSPAHFYAVCWFQLSILLHFGFHKLVMTGPSSVFLHVAYLLVYFYLQLPSVKRWQPDETVIIGYKFGNLNFFSELRLTLFPYMNIFLTCRYCVDHILGDNHVIKWIW